MFSSIYTHKIMQRLQKMRPLAAFTTVATVLIGGLLLLPLILLLIVPLILLFVFVGFIGMTLLRRQYMRQHRTASSPLSTANPKDDIYHDHPNIERENSNQKSRLSHAKSAGLS
ncbi:hypothetical protein HNW13_015860 [Shewanella sp. BF02_Schw]|uniref:hypothetical protein n=1 Tax=Shewanella sp. BF02_Schw TaxID=394908 RepID=UPI001785749E|nr:hypothetical protein [Shewanella sp. BF02_Schw]MBO1897213.1 hypothetical protein [Shewanella sp. BF02_Schw]